MTKVQVKITPAQRTALLKSAAVKREVERRTNTVHSAAGGDSAGYRAAIDTNSRRARGAVYTYSYKAVKDNAKNNTLIRALGAGRG